MAKTNILDDNEMIYTVRDDLYRDVNTSASESFINFKYLVNNPSTSLHTNRWNVCNMKVFLFLVCVSLPASRVLTVYLYFIHVQCWWRLCCRHAPWKANESGVHSIRRETSRETKRRKSESAFVATEANVEERLDSVARQPTESKISNEDLMMW